MQMIPRLLWQIGLLILWINPVFSNGVNPCGNISKKGSIRLKSEDVSMLKDLCDCYDFKKISFKNIGQLSIPFCLSANENLTTNSFSKNPIQRLPDGLEELKHLENLDVSFTEIVFLPEYISELTGLKTLNLRGTQIVSLPEVLDHLERIDMRMIDINRKGQEAMREHYRSVKIYFSSPCQCE